MIYLDHNATTNMHPKIREMLYELTDEPINASSIHAYGRKGKHFIDSARISIAALLGFNSCFNNYQVTFTSSGTEANNLVMSNFQDAEIFISSIEHPSIFAHSYTKTNITIIDVDENGVINIEDLTNKLKASTSKKKLLSVMLANNETGVIQPIQQISSIAHQYNALIHTDCVQAAGKIKIDILALDVDFVSISAHKFGGPMGAGALISRSSIPLEAQMIGGGQERRLRSGTENILAIVGFGEAARIAKSELDSRFNHMHKLRTKLESSLLASNHDIEIAGINVKRLPNTSLIINKLKKSETQLIALDLRGIAVSSGSACSSGKTASSYVLSAIGYSNDAVNSALRISVGVSTTEQEIDKFLLTYNEINK